MKDLITELGSLAEKLSAGWHEGIEIDASDIMLMNKTADLLEQQAAEIERLKATSKPNCTECTKWAKEQSDNREWIEGVAKGKRIVEKLAAEMEPHDQNWKHGEEL